MAFLMNKDKFNDIEDGFKHLKSNNFDISSLRKISTALSNITGKTIEVTVVKPESKNQECFVMSVYPDESILDEIINAIVSEQKDHVLEKIWENSTKWNIEIDTRILDPLANLTERELTALLLHEVGHIIYSNSIPMRISKIIKYKFVTSSMVNKELMRDTFFNKLLYIPLLNVCGSSKHKDTLKGELKADKYSANSGYKGDLSSAIDKIIIMAGSSSNPDKQADELTGFSIDALINLQKRQNKLVRKNLGSMLKSTSSPYSKKAMKKLNEGLVGYSTSPTGTVTEAVKDNFINSRIDKIIDDFYASEAFFNKVQKLKKLDPADIDYIVMELDNIKSNDDKMMIVSYIYSKIDTIDYYIALIDSKNPRYSVPHTRESLVQMRNRLEEYKNAAVNRKLPEINYGINIQWPTGYEG